MNRQTKFGPGSGASGGADATIPLRLLGFLAIAAGVLSGPRSWADSIIPRDRLYAWGTWCGHRDANYGRGPIPRVSTVYTNLGNLDTSGKTDVTAGLQQAINRCPSNQVV